MRTKDMDKWAKKKNTWCSMYWCIRCDSLTTVGSNPGGDNFVVCGVLWLRGDKTNLPYHWEYRSNGELAWLGGDPPRGGPLYVVDRIEEFATKFAKAKPKKLKDAKVQKLPGDLSCPYCDIPLNTRPSYECDDQEMVCLNCGESYLLSAQRVAHWIYSTRKA